MREPPRGGRCLLARGMLLLTLALGVSGAAAAQGLGDAAAREKDRRTRTKDLPAKVFTDQDLQPAAESRPDSEAATEPIPEAASDDEASDVAPASPPEPVDPIREQLDRERERRALQEREWRARFDEARARVRAAEARCWQEVVRTEYYNGIPVQMKVQEFVETEEFRQTKQALSDLEEEFRRTGLPPGWARE